MRTNVAGRNVPIQAGDPTLVWFSQESPDDATPGVWEFWTLFDDARAVTGRCREGSDPGERFRRMEGQVDYEDAWAIAAGAVEIRPATRKAVTGWLNSHRENAQFAEFCRIGSTMMRVLQTPDGVELEREDNSSI